MTKQQVHDIYEKGYNFGYAQAVQDLKHIFNQCMRKMNNEKNVSDLN